MLTWREASRATRQCEDDGGKMGCRDPRVAEAVARADGVFRGWNFESPCPCHRC